MSTKAQFEALRDSNWNDTATDSPNTPLRDPVCDRTIFNLIKDEFFSEILEDDGTSTNVITKVATGISYHSSFKKVGNKVDFQIALSNVSGSTIAPSTNLFDITNSIYLPKALTSQTYYYINGTLFSGTPAIGYMLIRMSDGKVYNGVAITSGTFLRVSGTYFVSD